LTDIYALQHNSQPGWSREQPFDDPFLSSSQDDCLAINRGSNIVFQRNTCTNGHGISIVRLCSSVFDLATAHLVIQGSIDSDVTVSGIVIAGNTIINKFVMMICATIPATDWLSFK